LLILYCVGESNLLQRAIESGVTQLETPNLACARLTSSTTEIVDHDKIEYPGATSELCIIAIPIYFSTAPYPNPYSSTRPNLYPTPYLSMALYPSPLLSAYLYSCP